MALISKISGAHENGMTRTQSVAMLAIMTLVATCSQTDRSIMSMVLEPIRREFLLKDAELGLLAGLAFSIAHAIVVIPFGMLADRVVRCRLIAGCMFVWSVMTALCGMATSFVHLLFARMGVGGGEAGAQSASLSLVSDLFEAKHRATATAIFYLSGPVGAILAGLLGGPVTATYGWRTALVLAGIPGLFMTVALLFFGKEPLRPSAVGPATKNDAPSLGLALAAIGKQKSLLHLLTAMTLATFVISGVGSFGVSFFLRYHGISQSQMGAMQGVVGAGSTIALLAGGFLSDRLARRDRRFGLWLIILMICVATPLLLTAYLVASPVALLFYFGGTLLGQFWIAPSYSLAQTLVPARMRATGAAVQFILMNLVGFGCGPLIAGLLSDTLANFEGVQGLRYALVSVALVYLWAALHFFLATGSLVADLDRAETL